MKCDELEKFDATSNAERSAGIESRYAYDADEVDEAIAELQAENAQLKRENENIKDAFGGTTIAYNQVFDEYEQCNKELRATKRALWLARADRAVAEQTVDEWSRYKEKHPFGSWRADPFEYWVQAWIYVEKLCRKKAKEADK